MRVWNPDRRSTAENLAILAARAVSPLDRAVVDVLAEAAAAETGTHPCGCPDDVVCSGGLRYQCSRCGAVMVQDGDTDVVVTPGRTMPTVGRKCSAPEPFALVTEEHAAPTPAPEPLGLPLGWTDRSFTRPVDRREAMLRRYEADRATSGPTLF